MWQELCRQLAMATPPATDWTGTRAGSQHKRQQSLKVAVSAPTHRHKLTFTERHTHVQTFLPTYSYTQTHSHT